MKKLFPSFLLAAIFAAVTSLWSCVDPANDVPPTPPVEPSVNVTLLGKTDPSFPATSAMFGIKSQQIESYVYLVEEGENKPPKDPAMLYAEAKETFKIEKDTMDVTVYGLEGSKKYTVHFAFKVKDQVKYLSKSLSTTMPEYDQLINVVTADRRSIKVHFNAAPGQNYRYLIMDKVTYHALREYGAGDIDLLGFGQVVQGPQLIHQYDGQMVYDPMEDEEIETIMKPFTNYVVLYGECDENGKIWKVGEEEGGGGGMDPLMSSSIKPNTKYYTEVCTDDWYDFRDKYAKCELWTAPAIVGEGKFTIDKRQITELNSYFSVIPPSSVKRYGAAIIPKSVLTEEAIPVVGEDGLMSYALQNLTTPIEGPQILRNPSPLMKDTTYVLLLIGMCDEDGETQIIHQEEFKAIVSDKPAVELVITQVPAKDESPYLISFNVKAPSKNCVSAKYAMNYTKEWVKAVKAPATYESFTIANGQDMTKEEVDAINSSEGLLMNFNSWEDIESILCVASFNEDDKAKGFIQNGRSLAEKPKTKVESELFTKLLGTWDVVYTAKVGTAASKAYKFKTTIAAGPEEAPSTFAPGDAQYTKLHTYFKNQAKAKGMTEEEAADWATAQITEQLADYKRLSPLYAQKYRGQNRLVMRGFAYSGFTGLPYKSPWDLFNTTTYSSYDVEQSFYDYGTKLFLEIRKTADGKDVVTVEHNPTYIAPFSNYTYNRFISGGIDGSYMYLDVDYPVTVVSDNELKIAFSAKNDDGKDCPFMAAYTSNGQSYSVNSIATADIKLTRAAAPAAAPSNYSIGEIVNGDYRRSPFDFKRTVLRSADVKMSTVDVPVVTREMIDQSFKKKANSRKVR